ncbi:E3 UBIQUITIN-PROTEIN LIGASE RNF123 [Salix koriyanagi]|uniref:E3 UBIQUITIN-PROTEIN LIGASE RNF123 n=1 Tax=Salix koriyanagi TaxID=2511006 RepID=A0A9Q0ZGG3_9ROSI|nr:E3 UBIQUITIN-PROTEIN LIGASE RNF123 [Salix koriyanagi]
MSLFSTADAEFFDLSLRRHRHSPEKVNRGMILAPLVGIISNLLDARVGMECGQQNDVVGVFASLDCPGAVHCGFQYLLEYNWTSSSRGDDYSGKLQQIESFLSLLVSRIELQQIERMKYGEETEADDNTCCICYSCKADAQYAPCSHRSCYGCITILMKNGFGWGLERNNSRGVDEELCRGNSRALLCKYEMVEDERGVNSEFLEGTARIALHERWMAHKAGAKKLPHGFLFS